jgi:hypothetical protein
MIKLTPDPPKNGKSFMAHATWTFTEEVGVGSVTNDFLFSVMGKKINGKSKTQWKIMPAMLKGPQELTVGPYTWPKYPFGVRPDVTSTVTFNDPSGKQIACLKIDMRLGGQAAPSLQGWQLPKAIQAIAACQDSGEAQIEAAGYTCGMLKGAVGCDTDLSTVNPNVPAGTLLKNICEKTCGNCDMFTGIAQSSVFKQARRLLGYGKPVLDLELCSMSEGQSVNNHWKDLQLDYGGTYGITYINGTLDEAMMAGNVDIDVEVKVLMVKFPVKMTVPWKYSPGIQKGFLGVVSGPTEDLSRSVMTHEDGKVEQLGLTSWAGATGFVKLQDKVKEPVGCFKFDVTV